MDVASIGFATDLAILRLSGSEVIDHGDLLVIRTPANPDYYWGNFILVAASVEPEAASRWVHRFSQEFPAARHIAIGIDIGEGCEADLPALAAAGMSRSLSKVLTLDSPVPMSEPALAVEIRALGTPRDWEQLLELRTALAAEEGAPIPDQLPFLKLRVAQERHLAESGRARYFGAFLPSGLVASLGLVGLADGICRYQNVETRIEHRRKGLATALLGTASAWAYGRSPVQELVIVADPGGPAIGLYRTLGFADLECQVQWQKEPRPEGPLGAMADTVGPSAGS